MMRQYMVGIPDELLEAARIDGASDWKIYRHIILPLSAPALGAVGILSFTWRWNDYLWPLIVIGDQKNFTLQLSLANLVGTNTVEWGTLLAYATLAMLPVLILMTILLAFEFGLLLSALTVKYRDIRHTLPFVLQLWMFLTPVVYPLSVVPQKWRWLMYINPLTGIVEGIRSVFTAQHFNWTALVFTTVAMVVMLIWSVHTFRRIEKSFADLI